MSFENPETWWMAARAIVLLAAFGTFAWALLAQRRDTASGFAQLAAQHAQALTEINRLALELSSMNEQVRELTLPSPVTSRRLVTADPAPAALPPVTQPQVQTRGYDMAIRMARGGASIDDIVANCGTTHSEARLL